MRRELRAALGQIARTNCRQLRPLELLEPGWAITAQSTMAAYAPITRPRRKSGDSLNGPGNRRKGLRPLRQ